MVAEGGVRTIQIADLMGAPNELLGEGPYSVELENAALVQDIARLAEENARLLNAKLAREHALLAHENALLQLNSSPLAAPGLPAPGLPAPGIPAPGMGAPGLSPPTWWSVESTVQSLAPQRKLCSQFDGTIPSFSPNSSIISTCADSSVTDSMLSCSSSDEIEEKTTVMIRNIPNSYSRQMLLDLLDNQGFRGNYNLLYLPIDFNTNAGFGYAFVNFVDTEAAERFMIYMQGFCDWAMPSEKVCDVTWSTAHQGLDCHIERYRNSPMMHHSVPDELKPVVFVNGERVPFPAPTKKPRAPRIRRRQ